MKLIIIHRLTLAPNPSCGAAAWDERDTIVKKWSQTKR